jgi:hypothetical protein
MALQRAQARRIGPRIGPLGSWQAPREFARDMSQDTSSLPILRAAAGASQEGLTLTSVALARFLTMSAGKTYSPSKTPCDTSTIEEPSSSLFAFEVAFKNSVAGLKFSHAMSLFCFLHSSPALRRASAPAPCHTRRVMGCQVPSQPPAHELPYRS